MVATKKDKYNPINKLNDHGIHFATIFKKLIADFCGMPYGKVWKEICTDVKLLKKGGLF